MELPSDWAIEEALRRLKNASNIYNNWTLLAIKTCASSYVSAILLAQLIEKYEERPVDPDVLVVRELLGSFYEASGLLTDARQFRSGEKDDKHRGFSAVVETYKRLKTQK